MFGCSGANSKTYKSISWKHFFQKRWSALKGFNININNIDPLSTFFSLLVFQEPRTKRGMWVWLRAHMFINGEPKWGLGFASLANWIGKTGSIVCHHMWLQVFYLPKPAILRLTCTSYLESATFRLNRARWMVPCSSHFRYQHCKQMRTKWGLTSFTQGVGWSTKENQDSHKFENTTVSSDTYVYVKRMIFYAIERYTQTSCFIHMYVHKCIYV